MSDDVEVFLLLIERTEKIMMGSIKSVISEPIKGCEHYHILVSHMFVNHNQLPYSYKFSRYVYFADVTNSAFLRFYFRGSQDLGIV